MAHNPIVTIEMEDGGVMKAELYPDVAPNTVNNFISLIQKGYYDGLIFHRVIPGFMIQGGCPDGTGMGGPGYSIKGEFTVNGFQNNLVHDRGVLSMARTMAPDSAGSQFFVMVEKAPHLDGQYAAFGKVIEGMEVADAIVNTKRDWNDKPRQPQRMKKVTVPSAWTTPSRRRSDFSRVSVSHTGARLRAGMVPTFIFLNQDGFLPNGGEAASQIEAQRKRV